VPGPSNYIALLVSRATMTGFVVRLRRSPPAGDRRDGRLGQRRPAAKRRGHRPGDIEMLPNMLARLFTGQNTGKLALRIRTGRARGTPNAARAGRPWSSPRSRWVASADGRRASQGRVAALAR